MIIVPSRHNGSVAQHWGEESGQPGTNELAQEDWGPARLRPGSRVPVTDKRRESWVPGAG